MSFRPAGHVALISMAASACLRVHIGKDAVESRVVAEFDPGADKPLLPFPNDVARDPTGRIDVPAAMAETEAEGQLFAYFSQLDGYPPESVPWMTFSGDIDPTSRLQSTFLVDLTAPDAPAPDFTAEWSAAARRLLLAPKAPLKAGHSYAAAVWSSARGGLRAKDGKPVLASPAFYLVRGKSPLVTCRDLSSPTCQSASDIIPAKSADPAAAKIERRDAALALERIRLSLQPVYDRMEAKGIARDEIALAWTFTVSTAPTARFDVHAGQAAGGGGSSCSNPTAGGGRGEVPIPFPNDLLRDPATGKIDLPIASTDPDPVRALKLKLADLDGFSTTAPLRAGVDLPDLPGSPPLAQALDPAKLGPDAMPIAPASAPGERADYTVEWEPETLSLKAHPVHALRSKTAYLGALTSAAATTAGRPLRAPLSVALLRMTAPVAVGGQSQIRGLSDADAQIAEAGRLLLAPAFDALAKGAGIARENVAVLFPFTTQTVSEVLPDLRALPEKLGAPTAASAQIEPADPNKEWNFKYVDSIVEGTLEVPVLLDRSGGFRKDWSQATLETIPYVITLPRCTPPGMSRSPVAIVLHALGSYRLDDLGAADPFAERCWALAGIDLPFHGDRSLCFSDGDCDEGTCDATQKCVGGNGLRLQYDRNPVTSGQGFINPADLFATRDNMRQAVIDNAQLLRVLRAPDGPAALPGVTIDAGQVSIVGVSMGGMIATMLLAAMPEPTTGVFSTTAADIIGTLTDSPDYGPFVLKQLASYCITPGTPAFRQFDLVARWVIDGADPVNYAELVQTRSLQDALTGMPVPPKRVIVQMGQLDTVMPNKYTRLLADLIGVSLDQTTFANAAHQALVDPTDPDWARMGHQAAGFVASGGAMVPPP